MALILVVEDDFGILALVEAVLQEEGYQTASVGNGREALAYLANSQPDLVLCDLMMPFVSGRDLFQAMLADPAYRGIPFVLMSAIAPMAQRDSLPYAAVVAKPFDLDNLVHTVQTVLHQTAPS